MSPLSNTAVRPLIRLALREDRASADATSRAVVPVNLRIRARIIAKAPGILAGGPIVLWTFQAIDSSLRCRLLQPEGARLVRGATILTIEGRARSIMAAERTALNFLMHLSGIATLTAAYAARVRGTRAKIFDTRKTLPGLRVLEKYAVRAGGGQNHRKDLAQAILIKTNHVKCGMRNTSAKQIGGSAMMCGGECGMAIRNAVANAKRLKLGTFVEIEVTNLNEFKAALATKPDAILLDNWRLTDIRKAVALRNGTRYTVHGSPLLEVSGGVTLKNVRAIARTGVKRISIGRLTHSAPALDFSLKVLR